MSASPRSYLFVPGNRPERFDKAFASGADAVIVDLEDAVPPDQKDGARQTLAAWLRPGRPTMLRINSSDTPWFAADLELARQPGWSAVIVPKSEAAQALADLRLDVPLIPLIETAAGFDGLDALARVSGVQRLAFGAIDFQLDMGMEARFEDLLYFRSRLVLASRLASIGSPVDSPCTAFDGDEVLNEAAAARRLGFGGKLCIHPKQVEPVNRQFAPSPEEVEWARRVIAIAGSSQGAAVALDGKMVDKPVILRAERILAAAR